MKRKQLMTILILGLGWSLLLVTGQPVGAAPLSQTNSATLVAQGDTLLWESKFSEAEAAYDAAIAADPSYAPAYAHRCYLRTFQEQYADALADCQQAVALAPDEAEGYIYLTRAYNWNEDFVAAIETGEEAIALAPKNGLAHSFLGEAHVGAGDKTAGEAEIRLGVELAPDNPEVHRNLAYMYREYGQTVAAIAPMKAAVDLAPGFVRFHDDIGWFYRILDRYTEALDHYQQALTIVREVGDRIKEGEILNLLGIIYDDQGRYEEALDHYRQALAIRREVGNRFGEGQTLHNLGLVYSNQGRYAEALDHFQQALAIMQEMDNQFGETYILHQIASRVYSRQGRQAEVIDVYQYVLPIHRDTGNRIWEGATLHMIGTAYYDQGRYGEALDYFQQALIIRREVGEQNEEASTLAHIGTVYYDQGRYTEALDYFQQALAKRKEGGNRASEGNDLRNIGLAYYNQDRYEEALDHYGQALVIHQAESDRTGEGDDLYVIGQSYRRQGRYDEALHHYQQALAIWQEEGDRRREGNNLYTIGQMYYDQGRYAEALDSYQQAMDVLEVVRAMAGSEQGRASFIAQYASLYVQAAGLFHQLGQDEDAFFTSERGRARAFLDSLATGQVHLSDNAAADLLAHEQEAYAQRQAAQDALAKARVLDPPDPALVADLEAQLAKTEAAYAEALAAIEARRDQLAALVPGRSTVLSLAEVQALLDPQTTLLSYFVLDDQTLAFLITIDSFEVVELDISGQELANQVSRFRNVIAFREPDATRPVAQELYRLLLAPLASSLRTPRLTIVPHGPLHYLPFAALLDPETDRYLVQNYSLVTLPSASALPFIQKNIEDFGSPLVLGNPTTGDFDATASLAVDREGLGSLPFAEKEAEVIAALYGVEPLIGKAATESVVRERVAGAGVLHLAAHGYYNPVAPLSSLIALAPGDTYDGWLTAGEVYGLDLNQTDLVVLSACQTQLGELSAGDEVVGLTRAFIFAGARTVVATLWNVDDAATALLMERFYIHLNEGLDKADALREAQLELIEEGTYADPFYWSAFVMSGDGGDVEKIAPTTSVSGEDESDVEETPPAVSLAGEAKGVKEETSPVESVSDEVEGDEDGAVQEIPWGWLIAAVGLLVVVVVGGMLWRRDAKQR